MDGTEKSYRILRLIESNYKRIQALDITPNRTVNKIAGRNKAGKSSAIDGIQAAIGGAKCFPIQPVRTGAEQAEILCILGDDKPELLVKRVIQENGKTALEITSAEGYKAPSPQAILDGLYNRLAFNPQAFLFMDDKPQLEMLRKMVGLDFTEADKERAQLYSERALANKQAKSYAAQAEGVVVPPGTPDTEVSVADLMDNVKRRQEHNRKNQIERDKIGAMDRDIATGEATLGRMSRSITDQEEKLAQMRRELESTQEGHNRAILLRDAQAATAKVLEDANVEEVQVQIVNAQTVNQNVGKARRKTELLAALQESQAESKLLTTQIEAIDADKEKQLSEVKWPVEGLAFGENGVLYKGVPFSQASGAEQLEVSFAMSAAMSPRLKVALIRNASLLDEEQMEVVCRLADKLDVQVFLEVVGDESGPATVLIEDGLVTRGGTPVDTAPVEKPKRARKTKAGAEPQEAAPAMVSAAADDESERNGTGVSPLDGAPFDDDQPELPFME